MLIQSIMIAKVYTVNRSLSKVNAQLFKEVVKDILGQEFYDGDKSEGEENLINSAIVKLGTFNEHSVLFEPSSHNICHRHR